MVDEHGVLTPLLIAIDDDKVADSLIAPAVETDCDDKCRLDEPVTKEEPLETDQSFSDGAPRRRPAAHVSELNEEENDADSDDDDDNDARDDQPSLSIELHWIHAVVIQILTASVSLAVVLGIFQFLLSTNPEDAVVFHVGALLLGGFWTASGLVLTYKKCQANKRIQFIILMAPAACALLLPLMLGMICYQFLVPCFGPSRTKTKLKPKVVCVHIYKILLLLQLVLSIAFWFGCLAGIHEDAYVEGEVTILNFFWMLFVRLLLFLDIKNQILDEGTDPREDRGSVCQDDGLLLIDLPDSNSALVDTV